MRFVVPMPVNFTNPRSRKSRHWRQAHRDKMALWTVLDVIQSCGRLQLASIVGRIPRPPREPFARVSMRSTMYLGGAMDDDNALARHKPLLDWLKTRGYLADDRKKNIVWQGLPEQVVKRDGNYRIELELTPLESR